MKAIFKNFYYRGETLILFCDLLELSCVMNNFKNVMFYVKSKAMFYVCIFLVLVMCLVILLSSYYFIHILWDAVEFDSLLYDKWVCMDTITSTILTISNFSNGNLKDQVGDNIDNFTLPSSIASNLSIVKYTKKSIVKYKSYNNSNKESIVNYNKNGNLSIKNKTT